MKKPQTILDYVVSGTKFTTPNGEHMSSRMRLQTDDVIVMACDNGNSSFKGAMLRDDGSLATVYIPCAYRSAEAIISGRGATTYRTQQGEHYWIGDVALQRDGEALHIGSTDERLGDLRQRQFLAAAWVETLIAAGYQPGEYTIALSLSIPNSEVRQSAEQRGMGVNEETKGAINRWLKKEAFTIERTDIRGTTTTWTLRPKHIIPQAQTLGTFISWSHSPFGEILAQDYEAIVFIDIGSGDLQISEIILTSSGSRRSYSMTSRRAGDGIIVIARALQRRFPGCSEIAAQQALITRKLRIGGILQDVGHEIDEVISTTGEAVLSKILPELKRMTVAIVISAGGALLLHNPIMRQVEAVGREPGPGLTVINNGHAPYSNVIGGLFAAVFAVASRKR
jgi:hypothetical protein